MNNKLAGWICLVGGVLGGALNLWALSLGEFDPIYVVVAVVCFGGAAYGLNLLRNG